MAEDILTRAEVELLLRGVGGRSLPVGESGADAIQPHEPGHGEERMILPEGLDRVHRLFGDAFAAALRSYLRVPVAVRCERARVLRYEQVLHDAYEPVDLSGARRRVGVGVHAILDRDLVAHAVATLFGASGSGRPLVRDPVLTFTGRRVAERLQEIAEHAYQTVWHAVPDQIAGAEPRVDDNSVPPPTWESADLVAETRVRVEFGPGHGTLHLCTPYASLDSQRGSKTRSQQRHERTATQGRAAPDERIANADVELAGSLARATITVRELLGLERGDVIAIDLPATVTVEAAGVPMFECGFGLVDGRYALQVQRVLHAINAAGEESGGTRT